MPNVDNIFLSWEDFYWPIKNFHFSQGQKIEGEEQTKVFVEHLLFNLPKNAPIYVEQRMNGSHFPIIGNPALIYGYYHPFSLDQEWYGLLEKPSPPPRLISTKFAPEKQFLEWFSRISSLYEGPLEDQLVIGQLNLIDNTFDDDSHHFVPLASPSRLAGLTAENKKSFFKFLSAFLPTQVRGFGLWSVWSNINGQLFNSSFSDLTGWEVEQGSLSGPRNLSLFVGGVVRSNFGYARVTVEQEKINLLIEYSSQQGAEIEIQLGEYCQTLSFEECANAKKHVSVSMQLTNLAFSLTLIQGDITLHRVDLFEMELKSFFLIDQDTPGPLFDDVTGLIDAMLD